MTPLNHLSKCRPPLVKLNSIVGQWSVRSFGHVRPTQPRHSTQGHQEASPRQLGICGFLPFGRDIFGTQPEEPADEDAEKQEFGLALAEARMPNFTPYTLFIVTVMDCIDHEFASLVVQSQREARGSRVAVACNAWHALDTVQKVQMYQAFGPLCCHLNAELAASGVFPSDLQDRTHAYSSSLQPPFTNLLEHMVHTALQKQLGLGPPPAAPTSNARSTAAQGLDDTTLAQIAADEADMASLQLALVCIGSDTASFEHHLMVAAPGGEAGQMVGQAGSLPGGGSSTGVTAHPDVRLVTHIRPQANQADFWGGFMGKCRMAWDVFFPTAQVLSPAGAVRARLQMILVSDRSGLDVPTLMRIRNQSLTALAESNGWDNLSELELQVSCTKSSGESVKLNLPLSNIPSRFMLRNAEDYDYELGEGQALLQFDDEDELVELQPAQAGDQTTQPAAEETAAASM